MSPGTRRATPRPRGPAGRGRVRSTAFWDLYGRVYDAAWDSGVTGSAATLAALLVSARSNSVVVDLGCGTGLFSHAFQGDGRLVLGVDHSHLMLRRARDLRRITAGVRADACATGLRSGIAEVVILANILHLTADPQRLLAEASRLVSATPGARLVCVTPTPATSLRHLATGELETGRSLPRVMAAQMVRAHVALLADLTGAVQRPDWPRLREALDGLPRAGWDLEHIEGVASCQEIRVFARPYPTTQ